MHSRGHPVQTEAQLQVPLENAEKHFYINLQRGLSTAKVRIRLTSQNSQHCFRYLLLLVVRAMQLAALSHHNRVLAGHTRVLVPCVSDFTERELLHIFRHHQALFRKN